MASSRGFDKDRETVMDAKDEGKWLLVIIGSVIAILKLIGLMRSDKMEQEEDDYVKEISKRIEEEEKEKLVGHVSGNSKTEKGAKKGAKRKTKKRKLKEIQD